MGWASAGYIFDPVCEALQKASLPPESRKEILVILIRRLQDGDWDTEDESLECFAEDPVVVEAFAECGILLWGSEAYKKKHGWTATDEEWYERAHEGKGTYG